MQTVRHLCGIAGCEIFFTNLPFMYYVLFTNTSTLHCALEEMKLTPFEEEELMKKWQEILGPSNEVVVSFFDQSELHSLRQQIILSSCFRINFFITVNSKT